ncbi:TonB-dependent receptor plug domain-containing protein [Chitinophaga nivalis]|uniref:TonB-dependent receptor plug domain-containing protein n=1 Tax=Chitinophaga nivalis TaxID=2991709 RepID=A0ABT3IH64_9BACT|nr:TonB-dependent receptor plug domain-containing protein [Chitinophaga nivalis]MCW3467017.1 TonB-dependent receptor plug domain-containing protein [Chitinophaga nivalis]MCW3483292.1 TonB-dependent receptor plug domain-containing protein [Chitinophaga nivalis]
MRISIITAAGILCGWLLSGYAQAQESRRPAMAFTDTAFAGVKVIDKAYIHKMGAVSLTDVLRYELNIETEQYPADGGARTRVFDLDSRYFKILVNGIPIGGADMFGGRVDISSIPLANVDSILITQAPLGVAYGSGTLTGIANIITHKGGDAEKTTLRAFLQEESVGDEYNLRFGHGARGRHVQGLSVNHQLSRQLSVGVSGVRNRFNGHRGAFNGDDYTSGPSYQRGYEWSPYTAWNAAAYLAFQSKTWSAYYTCSHFNTDLTFYGHGVEQEFAGNEPLPLYAATDNRYVNRRTNHHINLRGSWWKGAAFNIDLSLQEGSTKRGIGKVNTENNKSLEDVTLTTLYATKTFYARAGLEKALTDNIKWQAGLEMDRTNGFIAVAPGTYLSREIDRSVFSIAGFTFFQWQVFRRFAWQPGFRLAGNGLSKAYPTVSLSMNYDLNPKSNLQLTLEQVRRFPNHRELFTYLENEFNLLEGNEALKPETGNAVLLTWQYRYRHTGNTRVQIAVQSGFRELKDRIIIVAMPYRIPTQEVFQYANLNKQYSWLNKVTLTASSTHLQVVTGIFLTGLKGNDYAHASQYDKYLFHTQATAAVTYTFSNGYWLHANYRFTGRQPVYSFERELPAPALIRVHNRAPAFHMLDINAGQSFFNNQLEASIGVRNLLGVKEINFHPTDGQEHYRGDLRTLYAGYGRSAYLRLGYRIGK